ncbi:MAG: phosphoglucosamine mutase, partial [Butyricicoccaceae bacterium]
DIVCANVGDRYVLEKMLENGYCLGGEQSGHVIFLEYASTGDGELTAIQFLSILRDSGKKASEIAAEVMPWPQLLVNVAVPNTMKATIAQHPTVKKAIEQAEGRLGGGRILVRPSGTEALVRVMVEAEDAQLVESTCNAVAEVIQSVL